MKDEAPLDEAYFNDLIDCDDEYVPDDDDWQNFLEHVEEDDLDDREEGTCCDCCGCILNDSNSPIMGTVCIGCLGISEDD